MFKWGSLKKKHAVLWCTGRKGTFGKKVSRYTHPSKDYIRESINPYFDPHANNKESVERKWCPEERSGRVRLKECSTTSRQKWILNEDDGTIRLYNNEDKCLERRGSSLYMTECTRGSSRQKFDFNVDASKFEIRQGSNCVTQEHHPRSNEKLKMQTCSQARRDDTSLWKCR